MVSVYIGVVGVEGSLFGFSSFVCRLNTLITCYFNGVLVNTEMSDSLVSPLTYGETTRYNIRLMLYTRLAAWLATNPNRNRNPNPK